MLVKTTLKKSYDKINSLLNKLRSKPSMKILKQLEKEIGMHSKVREDLLMTPLRKIKHTLA